MKHSTIFSAASMAAMCALLAGGLYTGCSSDDVEENYDELITTLADETMTRAGEGSSGTVVKPAEPRDSSEIYLAMDTTIVQSLCAFADAEVSISSNEGFNDQINPTANVCVQQHGGYFGSTSATVNSCSFQNGSISVSYTVVLDNPNSSVATKAKGTYKQSVSVGLHTKKIPNSSSSK